MRGFSKVLFSKMIFLWEEQGVEGSRSLRWADRAPLRRAPKRSRAQEEQTSPRETVRCDDLRSRAQEEQTTGWSGPYSYALVLFRELSPSVRISCAASGCVLLLDSFTAKLLPYLLLHSAIALRRKRWDPSAAVL